jgi:microcystin-dependent protein
VSKLNYQYDLQNLTPANASPVEANFTRTEQHINQEVIERDGSVAMRAQLKLVGDPVSALDAAPKQYVDQVLPIGLITMWGAAAPPANGKWLLCDGAAVETALFPELFAVIGYAWGGAGGSFNTPNLSGRMAIGPSAAHPLGQKAGSEDSSLPAHTHPIDHTHAGSNTSNESQNHQHVLGGTTGASDRPLRTDDAGTHSHTIPTPNSRGWIVDGPGNNGSAGIALGDPNGYAFLTHDSPEGAHSHAVTDHLHGLPATTGNITSNHTHPFQTPGHAGPSGQTGVAPAGLNMPPFLSVPFIIRCR